MNIIALIFWLFPVLVITVLAQWALIVLQRWRIKDNEAENDALVGMLAEPCGCTPAEIVPMPTRAASMHRHPAGGAR